MEARRAEAVRQCFDGAREALAIAERHLLDDGGLVREWLSWARWHLGCADIYTMPPERHQTP